MARTFLTRLASYESESLRMNKCYFHRYFLYYDFAEMKKKFLRRLSFNALNNEIKWMPELNNGHKCIQTSCTVSTVLCNIHFMFKQFCMIPSDSINVIIGSGFVGLKPIHRIQSSITELARNSMLMKISKQLIESKCGHFEMNENFIGALFIRVVYGRVTSAL